MQHQVFRSIFGGIADYGTVSVTGEIDYERVFGCDLNSPRGLALKSVGAAAIENTVWGCVEGVG
ncbi:MAG: hypothetical protein AAF579_17550 [Cyanobacteria bacterium P01_C01_bin.118]